MSPDEAYEVARDEVENDRALVAAWLLRQPDTARPDWSAIAEAVRNGAHTEEA